MTLRGQCRLCRRRTIESSNLRTEFGRQTHLPEPGLQFVAHVAQKKKLSGLSNLKQAREVSGSRRAEVKSRCVGVDELVPDTERVRGL